MNRTTTLVHVIPSLSVGGAETCLTELVTAARSDAPTCSIASLMPLSGSFLEKRIVSSNISVKSLGVARAWNLPIAAMRLAGIIRHERPRVVQSWMYYGDLIAAVALRLSGRRKMTKLCWGIRCSDMNLSRYSARLRWTVELCAKLSKSPDVIVANSAAGRDVHIGLGYSPDNFVVIRNGIDTIKFRPCRQQRNQVRERLGLSTQQEIAIIAARVDPMKDFATFLKVVDRRPETTFLAVGKDTEKLPKRANLVGLGIRDDLPNFFAASDVGICTSAFGEGFPNVVAEAMACGTPVVTTNVGDAAEIVGATGVVVAPGDAVGLSHGIKSLISEGDTERQNRREAARERIITHFSLDRMVQQFDHVHCPDIGPADTLMET